MIVGNKTDLEPDRMVESEDGEGLATSMNRGFQEISGSTYFLICN